ncbi:MAG: glycine cleavage system protein GcvH [Inquilinus limosus]|uniref:Glycine cleavage system H protein n=1 Tax=Inquilinus limosus TaxID=171674 RepID=A0A952FQA0_9PROT|nr:glycine cleavage system protein GcvH [Inquilinus limosus]
MSTVYFTQDHEWIRVDGDIATVGITDFAQKQLGDVVFVELPEAGRTLDAGDPFGVVESVKAASEVFAPVSGTITEANEELTNTPELVNEDPTGEAWFIKLKLSDAGQLKGLMDQAAYDAFIKDEH